MTGDMNGIGAYLAMLTQGSGMMPSAMQNQTPGQMPDPQSYLQWLTQAGGGAGGSGGGGRDGMSGLGTAMAGSMGAGPMAGL